MPDVKLILLIRAPISRAWSHAKHSHRYQEANFAGDGEAKLADLQAGGRCFVASSLAEAKERVTQHIIDQAQVKLKALEGERRAVPARCSCVEEPAREGVGVRARGMVGQWLRGFLGRRASSRPGAAPPRR
jgi:hypothetical protein